MFNALKYIEELEKAGFTKEQSEASLKLLIEAMNENFATKADLKETEFTLRTELKNVESGLRTELKSVEAGLRTELKIVESGLRADFNQLEKRMDSQFHAVDLRFQNLDSQIKSIEYKLTIKLGAMMAMSVGITAALVKIL